MASGSGRQSNRHTSRLPVSGENGYEKSCGGRSWCPCMGNRARGDHGVPCDDMAWGSGALPVMMEMMLTTDR
jgi:hypothetical protein